MYQPIPPHYLAAHFQAGMAVTAMQYGIGIDRLHLGLQEGRRNHPRLTPFGQFSEHCKTSKSRILACSYYVTTLLAGSVGRMLGLERYLAYPINCSERILLTRALMYEALGGHESETDQAYCLVVGLLPQEEHGCPQRTLQEFWDRAEKLLRSPLYANNVCRIADELLRQGTLDGNDLQQMQR